MRVALFLDGKNFHFGWNVIIVENQIPTGGPGTNVISFTTSDQARYGVRASRTAESAS